ncbi:MAG: hypothetical protein ACYCQJ_14940 [Nitrososphaerales archaeon]
MEKVLRLFNEGHSPSGAMRLCKHEVSMSTVKYLRDHGYDVYLTRDPFPQFGIRWVYWWMIKKISA